TYRQERSGKPSDDRCPDDELRPSQQRGCLPLLDLLRAQGQPRRQGLAGDDVQGGRPDAGRDGSCTPLGRGEDQQRREPSGDRVSMTVAESWNLVAGGPSRANLRKGHLLEGPVVTVNRAIDIVERGIDVDFAAFSDGPGLAWRGLDLERHWRPGMILWVSAGVTQGTVKLPDGTKRGVPGPP